MLNKKIIAAAVAAAFTQAALADVNLNTGATGPIQIANETIDGTDIVSGNLIVTNLSGVGGSDIDVNSALGFTIGEGTSKYVRVDLDGATFGAVPVLTMTDSVGTALVVGTDYTATISQGGAVGDDYVIFEVAAVSGGGDLAPTDRVDLSAGTYRMAPYSVGSVSNVTYNLYETAADSVNETASLYTRGDGLLTVLNASNITNFTDENTLVATVASGFTQFEPDTGVATTTTGATGSLDASDFTPATNFFEPDGTLVINTDILDDSQNVVFTGDFSFGTWTFETAAACDGSGTVLTPTINTAMDTATLTAVADTAIVAQDWYLCVTVDGTETIMKSQYDITLVDDALTDGMGEIIYDTTTIEVPYLTTFADYNQRIYIINRGTTDAAYTMTFVGEAATTITPLAGATGVVPAGEMVALRAVDVVDLTGRTRVSATIEVEGTDGSISAATQTINLENGGTDTVVLNANSITSYRHPVVTDHD
ncbi:hypothetical protein [Aestuariibacter salexigens]|uniref:hypothetical protein n=1 Tax=Aestuariibacter salexigens TaxID=226010 RepID=UPI000428C69E|nr:hypothetical protein [Aestuariibacter salexigens]